MTIKDIADACFINIAAVNYHFGSKDNLIGIVINDLINNLKDQIFIEVKIRSSVDLKASLATMLEIIYNYPWEYWSYPLPIFKQRLSTKFH